MVLMEEVGDGRIGKYGLYKWRDGREKLTDGATKEDEVWPSFNQRPDILG